ncbi:MAG: acyl carrier protein [Bacillota bacterium]
MNVESKVREIVAQIVGVAPEHIEPRASFMEDMGLDSLRALEVLAAIENEYAITIDPERLVEMTNLENVINITNEYLS